MKSEVNLMDCALEPSDEQLEHLMRSVGSEARAKAVIADNALRKTLANQSAEVCVRYHLSMPRVSAVARL